MCSSSGNKISTPNSVFCSIFKVKVKLSWSLILSLVSKWLVLSNYGHYDNEKYNTLFQALGINYMVAGYRNRYKVSQNNFSSIEV